MMKEEDILERRFGKEPHFQVPAGYFENFADQLMERLPERKAEVVVMRPSRVRSLRPFLLAAASVCVAIFTVGMYLHTNRSEAVSPVVASAPAQVSYSDFDEVADYTMMDNQDFYAYVSDY